MKKFTTYNFENNGDIFGIDDASEFVYVGRCDSDGDVRFSDGYEELAAEVGEVLSDTMQRAMPGHAMSGDLDWAPSVCYVKAMGWEDRYRWDHAENAWNVVATVE